jgi:crotonobetainyl-CoA:carnitine CoA-transferase CaiB-like acyl-CoA transferase
MWHVSDRRNRRSRLEPRPPPLAGVRILEVAILGPGAITTSLADLGADIVQIESPAGDYIRQMTWPIVEGVSLMHLHISRGSSLVLDLKSPEGVATFLELARERRGHRGHAPRRLERCGLGYEELRKVNPDRLLRDLRLRRRRSLQEPAEPASPTAPGPAW